MSIKKFIIAATIQKNVYEETNKKDHFLKPKGWNAEGEIRTPVARSATGFQDRRRGPLGYLSMLMKYT